jgi:queuine tRNA-ribosyltransferase
VIALDQCTHPDAPAGEQRDSVRRTVAWGRRCREEFDRRLAARPPAGERPRLFAVIQGGDEPALRRECAEGLLAGGFDGYGYGGWPVDDEGGLVDAVGLTARLIPEGTPRLALGIGGPENVVAAHALGYRIFDCTLPTRDGRHGRLYVFRHGGAAPLAGDWCERVNIGNERFMRETGPVEPDCGCACCARYSRGYLHHLFKVKDAAALRLATIHNLRFFARLFERLGALP